MADEIIDPSAQGQYQADPGTNQQSEGVVPAAPDQDFKVGIQKRIDELTARFHQERESSSKKDEHILALTRQLMEQSNQRQAPAEQTVDVPEGMDPAQAAYFNKMFGKLQERFEAQLTQVSAYAQRGEAAQAAQGLAAKFGIVDAEKVAWLQERAASLAAGWKQQGLPFHPTDAARFATMELLEKGGLPRQAGNGTFMPANHANPGNPAPNLAPQNTRRALPNNFNSLRPEDQLSILQKNGVEDIPF